MTEIQEVPPMSGDNLPLKELETEKLPETNKGLTPDKLKKEKKRIYIIFALLIILFFAVGIWFGLYFKKKNDSLPVLSPEPSPSAEPNLEASPSASPVSRGLQGRIDAFGSKIKEIDLKEEDLSPPAIDFDISFKIKD